MATQNITLPAIPTPNITGRGIYPRAPSKPISSFKVEEIVGGGGGTVYEMRGMYAPGGTRTRWVYWDSPDSPDFAGTGQSEVPAGDLEDIGTASATSL